jgi:4-diphosphocytidyl-2-C-methyl-D-erythritol kinase
MISFPHAKINLGLQIISRRADGYHNIETILLPIGLCDALEVIPSEVCPPRLNISGLTLPDVGKPNACIQAFKAVQQLYSTHTAHQGREMKQLTSIDAHLHKCIPAGSGLGGGSADAAYMLKMLNTLFSLDFTDETMLKLAAGIGCDCSFFMQSLLNQSKGPSAPTNAPPVLATGRGDILEMIEIPVLSNKYLLLVSPPLHISTADAYAMVTPSVPCQTLREVTRQPIHTWKQTLKNDFETAVFLKHPEIRSLKDRLYEIGAVFASMTGSGSSVYGIFDKEPIIFPRSDFPECKTWIEKFIYLYPKNT